jgi:LmbE family N-acetylglucosaminyl deacetylase
MKMLRLFASVALVAALICCAPGRAEGAKSALNELTKQCDFKASASENSPDDMHDGRHDTAWTASSADGQFVEIDLPEGKPATGIYIQWNCVPESWVVLESSGGEIWQYADLQGRDSFINAYVPLSGHAAKIRIESESYDWKMSIAEIRVFASGTLPDDVQVWEPSPQKADLMVIPAHPDDEVIYFGGVLPYYAGQLGKHTVVVYMTSSPMIRKFEALNGLWEVGVREYPVFLPLQNKYSTAIEDAEKDWDGLDHTVSLLVEQIRIYKPDVVVTHDLNGEYGHGAHKLTALATEKAVDEAGDRSKYPDSAVQYGVWQVKKCYLHLYSKNKIEMDWNNPLSRFGGKTALDMAREGYALHVSQHFTDRQILDSGPYDNACFGLYYSAVGPDKKGGDLFENIAAAPVETSTPEPTVQPAATVKPAATVGSKSASGETEAFAPSSAQTAKKSIVSPNTAVKAFSLAVALIAFALLSMKHLTTAKHARKLFKARK